MIWLIQLPLSWGSHKILMRVRRREREREIFLPFLQRYPSLPYFKYFALFICTMFKTCYDIASFHIDFQPSLEFDCVS